MNDELASSSSTSLPKTLTSAEKIAEVFGEKQLKEIAFCKEKEKKARIEELLLGVMPQKDITPAMVALAEEYAAKLAKTQRERNNDQKLIQSKVSQKAVSRTYLDVFLLTFFSVFFLIRPCMHTHTQQ